MTLPPLSIVSMDTAQGAWRALPDAVPIENLPEPPRPFALLTGLAAPATHFTTYQLAPRDRAARPQQTRRAWRENGPGRAPGAGGHHCGLPERGARLAPPTRRGRRRTGGCGRLRAAGCTCGESARAAGWGSTPGAARNTRM